MGQSGTQSQAELIQATRAEGVSSRMRKTCHHGRGMRRGLLLVEVANSSSRVAVLGCSQVWVEAMELGLELG